MILSVFLYIFGVISLSTIFLLRMWYKIHKDTFSEIVSSETISERDSHTAFQEMMNIIK